MTDAIGSSAHPMVLVQPFPRPGRLCNWPIENLIWQPTGNKITF
jgi:hypothetical protein